MGKGRSRMRLIDYDHSISYTAFPWDTVNKMRYEDKNQSEIPTKILDSGEFAHLTAGR